MYNVNSYFYESLTQRILFAFASYPASTLLANLPHPWPGDTDLPQVKPQVKPSISLPVGGVVAGSSNLISSLTAHALAELDDDRRVPTQDTTGGDWLIDRIKGRWRQPPPWQRKDFERITGLSLEQLLAKIKAKHWTTPTAMARQYAKQTRWITTSLKFCLVREGLCTREEFDALVMTKTKTKERR